MINEKGEQVENGRDNFGIEWWGLWWIEIEKLLNAAA